MSAPLGVRYRRAVREVRAAALPLRVIAGLAALLLVADLVSLGNVGQGSSKGQLASTGHQSGPGTPGSPGGTTSSTAGGAASTTTPGGPGTTGLSGPSATNPTAGAPSATEPVGTGTYNGVKLTASDRGVTPTTIKVVFPYPNLGPIGQATGLDTTSEDPVMSIHTYVNDINAHGGILGRMIAPEIVMFNPLDDSDMRAKCLSWTQDQKVFAVVDATAWHDANQLCITQEGHTPLISGWTTVPLYTKEGAPNLWWTGPDDARVIQNLVTWAVGRGLLTRQTKYAIVAADRQGDGIALQKYLIPALRAAGLPPAMDIESMHFDNTDGLDSASQAPLIVTRMHGKGVTTIIPLLPFLNLSSLVGEEQSQGWDPVMLLSDYESALTAGLGLADAGDKEIDNQSGPTSYVLGTHDDPRGYSPAALDCYHVWMKSNPGVTPPPDHFVEATGTAMTYCQNIRLFAQAARMAGPNLTRAGFDAAMAQITNFPGTVVDNLSFAPGQYAGPHEYRTVQIHENGDHACPKLFDGKNQGSCWLIIPPNSWSEMTPPPAA